MTVDATLRGCGAATQCSIHSPTDKEESSGLGFLAGEVSLGNPARGGGIPTYLQSYLVKDVTNVYYLVSRPAEDTYIPPTGVTQSYLPR